jgi:hypothetical protein
LRAKVRGGIKEITLPIDWRHNHLCLRTRMKIRLPCSYLGAVKTSAIPLGKTSPGCRAEDRNAHANSELEFSVRVRTDFTAQADFFVLRGCPFHSQCSFIEWDLQLLSEVITEAENKTIPKLATFQKPLEFLRCLPAIDPPTAWTQDFLRPQDFRAETILRR